VLLLVAFIVPVKADNGQVFTGQESHQPAIIPIQPFWSHTQSMYVSLDIVNGRATMSGTVMGQIGTERISVTGKLKWSRNGKQKSLLSKKQKSIDCDNL